VKGARWKGAGEKMKMSFAGYGIRNMGYGEEMKIKIKMKRGLKGGGWRVK